MLIADAHNDLALEVAHLRGAPDAHGRDWLDPLREGGVGLQVCPLSVDLDQELRDPLFVLLEQATAMQRVARQQADAVALVRTRADLDALEGGSRIGLMLAIEDCSPFGRAVDWVEPFFELGVRMVSLTWNRRNAYADGGAEDRDGGLSNRGKVLVDRLVEAGIILDLAHASERTFFDVLEHAPEATVCVSHAATRAVYDVPRNLSDDQLRALAERDGVLGIMLIALAIDPTNATLAKLCDHVEHAVDVMGIDHVGFGSDPMRRIVELGVEDPSPTDCYLGPGRRIDDAIEGVSGPEHFPIVLRALVERGYTGDGLEAIAFGNLRGLIRRGLPD